MEDRHTLSEPRINSDASDGTLCWLVDVYRKGVDDPIDTIEISDQTLPPRKKKGKIVWRLPNDASRVVRIIFKNLIWSGSISFEFFSKPRC